MPHILLARDTHPAVVQDVADALVKAKAAARAVVANHQQQAEAKAASLPPTAVQRGIPTREFYDDFVSELSKSRKPSPSAFPRFYSTPIAQG
jgi:hypothetical protein